MMQRTFTPSRHGSFRWSPGLDEVREDHAFVCHRLEPEACHGTGRPDDAKTGIDLRDRQMRGEYLEVANGPEFA